MNNMKRFIYLGIVLIPLVFLLNCQKDDLPQLPFLEIDKPEVLLLDSVHLEARINFLSEKDYKAVDTILNGWFELVTESGAIFKINGTPHPIPGSNPDKNLIADTLNLGFGKKFSVTAFLQIKHKRYRKDGFITFKSAEADFYTDTISFVTEIITNNQGEIRINSGIFGVPESKEKEVIQVGHIWKLTEAAIPETSLNLTNDNYHGKKDTSEYLKIYEHKIEAALQLSLEKRFLTVRAYAQYKNHGKDTIVYGAIEYKKLEGFWEEVAALPAGIGCRYSAVGFATKHYGYIGLGKVSDDCETDGFNYKNDFWRFDPSNPENSWEELPPFPGAPRYDATSFVIGERIFVGLGRTQSRRFNDFYEYIPNEDPTLGKWIPIDTFPNRRRSAVSFVIGKDAYIVTGRVCGFFCDCSENLCFQNDIWVYKSESGIWIPQGTMPETDLNGNPLARLNAVGFSLNGKGYVSCGLAQDILGEEKIDNAKFNNQRKDLWEYNPSAPFGNQWQPKPDLNEPREKAVSFSDEKYGYIATGGYQAPGNSDKVPTASDFWRYNPTLEKWEELADMNIRRWRGVGFSTNNLFYVGLGQILDKNNKKFDNKLYRYIPETE